MINADRLRLGIAALRSGQYRQGHEMLRSPEGYCCLGVLTDIAIKHGGMEVAQGVAVLVNEDWSGEVWYEMANLPPVVQDWYGFEDADPYLFNSDARDARASACNDSRGMTLHEIADRFERVYLTDGQ